MVWTVGIAIVALLVALIVINYRDSLNIEAPPPGSIAWTCGQGDDQLRQMFLYVEREATNAIGWYWKKKVWKARLSRAIQWIALVLTATAGLLPVAGQLFVQYTQRPASILQSGLLSSVLVGSAAALLGLDKAFGFSTGWARYVLAGTEIRRLLETFRMEWMLLIATGCPPAGGTATPAPELVAALLAKARDFRVAVETVVVQETKDWVTEFQNNIAQLEKDAKAQLDTLKTQVERAAVAAMPGWIEMTVANAPALRDASFTVKLESGDGSVEATETVQNSRRWVRLNLRPGTYRVTVSGSAAAGTPLSTQFVVVVKPGEGAKPPDVTLS